jgi:formylglycine-generating enzyme required for sulfatase activity
MLSTVLLLTLAGAVFDGKTEMQPYEEKIPGTLVSFRMVPLPDGFIEIGGQRHSVKGLWMSETEVTWDLYDIWAFRLDMPEEQVAAGVDAESRPSRPYGAPDRGFGHAGYAAIGMTFEAAEAFCVWLSNKTGKKYRLPTEVEWEYAATCGGSESPELAACAWYWDNADDKTQPVKRKKANAWGLYDMLGNVGEWARGLDGTPSLCGGSFLDRQADVHPRARKKQTPDWNQTDPQTPKSKWWLSDAPFVGFRVVREG